MSFLAMAVALLPFGQSAVVDIARAEPGTSLDVAVRRDDNATADALQRSLQLITVHLAPLERIRRCHRSPFVLFNHQTLVAQ